MTWFTTTWSNFCDTLNTRGGTIGLLSIWTGLLFWGVIHVMHHGDSGQAAAVIISTFSSFTGALLLALTQKDRPPINGSGISSTTTTTTNVVTPNPTEEVKLGEAK